MDITSILQDLRAERDRLDRAIAAMEGIGPGGGPRVVARETIVRRTMSAAARARISAAQKARWARQKGHKATRGPKAAVAAKPRPRMSAAARKRLSELLKKRWASGQMGKRRKTKAA